MDNNELRVLLVGWRERASAHGAIYASGITYCADALEDFLKRQPRESLADFYRRRCAELGVPFQPTVDARYPDRAEPEIESIGGERMRVNPGDKVQDKISGATGIVICRAEWQYGCVRLTVQPREIKDGKPIEPFVIDEPQAEVLTEQEVPDTRPATSARSHGERPAATRRPDAER